MMLLFLKLRLLYCILFITKFDPGERTCGTSKKGSENLGKK